MASEYLYQQYIDDVLSGRQVACKWVRLAVERHVRDLETGPGRGLRFDHGAARHVIDFFGFLRHSKGEWAGRMVTLEPWQQFALASAFGWQRFNEEYGEWFRRFRQVFLEVARKNGKALSLDTPLPTPTGWISMGDVQIGTVLFDERGQPCRVSAMTEVMHDRPCYRMVFSDGEEIIADAEHLWRVTAHDVPFPLILTTETIRETLLHSYRVDDTRQIIAVEPVESVPVRCIQVDSPSHLFLAGRSMIPTHNSTIAAGVSLYLLDADGEPGAEVYCAATKREQARIAWSEAKRMVQSSQFLRRRIRSVRDNLHIVNTASKLEPLGRDTDSMDGLNVHGAIVDELHAHKNREIWDLLDTATGSRRQSLLFGITTAGVDKLSLCWNLHDYSEKILEQTVQDDSFFGIIYTLDAEVKDSDGTILQAGDDWEDEANWVKANPNLGTSKKMDDMRRKALQAKEIPTAQNSFLQRELNYWTQATVRWINAPRWLACGQAVSEDGLRGRTCFGGLDLSSTSDVTALVLVFPPQTADDPYQVVCRFWVPEETMRERTKGDRVLYETWVRQGHMLVTPGNVIDHDFIVSEIDELAQRYDIKEIAFDRWGAAQIQTTLQGMGGEDFLVQFGQGFASMSAPTKELERLIGAGRLAHGGQPVLTWMAGNVVASKDAAGNIKPDKAKSTEKIDGIVALIMALDRATRHQPEPESVYEERGIREL